MTAHSYCHSEGVTWYRLVWAARAHTCEARCGVPIERGEDHYYYSDASRGEWSHWRMHPGCVDEWDRQAEYGDDVELRMITEVAREDGREFDVTQRVWMLRALGGER